MSVKKIILILVVLFLCEKSYSQFDTNYVHLTKDRFIISPIFEFYKTSFKIFDKNIDKQNDEDFVERGFATKNNLYLGFGMSFYRLGFSISFLLPHSNVTGLEKSKSVSFVGGYTLKKLYGEIRCRKYNGFQEQITTYKGDTIAGKILTLMNQNSYLQFGGALYYFTAKKFNYDANFKNYNTQKKTAVSPLIFTNINYYKIKADLTIEDSTHVEKSLETAKITSVKLGGGLSGVYVYKSLYIALLGNAGISFKDNQVSSNVFFDSANSVHPYFEFKTSLGYNSNKYIAAFTFSYDNDFIYLKPNKVGINNYYMNFKVGYKFNSKYLGKAAKYL